MCKCLNSYFNRSKKRKCNILNIYAWFKTRHLKINTKNSNKCTNRIIDIMGKKRAIIKIKINEYKCPIQE